MGPEDEDELRERLEADDVEDEGQDGDGEFDDELDPDEGLDPAGQAAAGKDASHPGGQDPLGSAEGAAGQGSSEVRQPSRGETRFQKLANRARDAEEISKRALKELEEFKAAQQRTNGSDLAAQRAELRKKELDQLAANDRANGTATYWDARFRHQQEDMDARLQQVQFASADSADRTQFDGQCARNPALATIRDKVEERRQQELRATGITFPRETVAKFILGEMALQRGAAAKTRQQKRADVVRDRETVRAPRAGRSDVSRSESRSTDERTARAKRLDGLNI